MPLIAACIVSNAKFHDSSENLLVFYLKAIFTRFFQALLVELAYKFDTFFAICLTVFTNFYINHVKFYVHENLTAAGNFCKIFPCNLQNVNAADIFQFLENFPCSV